MADEAQIAQDGATTRSGRAWLVAGIIAGIVLLVVAGLYSYRTWTERSEATSRISEATTLIERADQVVVRVDEVVGAEISSQTAVLAAQVASEVPGASALLREAVETIDASASDADEIGRERALVLKEAALARLDMMSQAPAILDATRGASEALPLATGAWEQALEADRLGQRAVAAYNKLTRAGVRDSSRLNRLAATELTAGREGMGGAEKAFPAATFESYLAYLDLRIEMNKLSQQSDSLWLKDEFAKANAVISTYNEKDRKAVALAKTLPASPAKVVADAYEAAAKAATDEYYAARDRATEADGRVRRLF